MEIIALELSLNLLTLPSVGEQIINPKLEGFQ